MDGLSVDRVKRLDKFNVSALGRYRQMFEEEPKPRSLLSTEFVLG